MKVLGPSKGWHILGVRICKRYECDSIWSAGISFLYDSGETEWRGDIMSLEWEKKPRWFWSQGGENTDEEILKNYIYFRMLWNASFQVCGCCILGFGIFFLVQNTYGVLFRNLPFLTLGNVLVIVGSIIMVVAFLGCMGSIKENKCLLMSVSPCIKCDTLRCGRFLAKMSHEYSLVQLMTKSMIWTSAISVTLSNPLFNMPQENPSKLYLHHAVGFSRSIFQHLLYSAKK